MCGLLGEFGKIQSPKSDFSSLLKLSENRGSDMVGYYNNLKSISPCSTGVIDGPGPPIGKILLRRSEFSRQSQI